MSKSAEIEKMARLALSRQAETDMRVDAVEARAAETADASAGGRTPPPAAVSLDGLYGWRPKAFSVWFTTGGGGKVGVSFPEKCVSYNGSHMDDEVLTPAVQEDPETGFRWCELPAPQEAEPKLVLTLLVELDDVTHEPGDTVTVAYLEWAASVDAAKADHEETDRKVVACVPVAEYDAKLDRLVQVHVGALALGGGGGGGGKYTPWPEPFPYGAATVPEYTDASQTETRDVEYGHYVKADGFVFNGAGTTVPGSGIPVDESTTQVAIVSVGAPPEGWTPGPDGADPDELTWEHRLEKTSSGDVQPPPTPDHGAVVVTPLYDFDGYEVVKDYRGQFLPVTTGVARSTLDDRGPFAPVYSAAGGVTGFSDGYVQVGGFTVECAGPFSNPASPGQLFVAARVSVPASGGSGYSVALSAYSDFEALRSAQQNLDEVVYPLYRLAWTGDACSVDMDLRRMPTTGMLETFLVDSSASGGGGS